MLRAFPDAYDVEPSAPDEQAIVAVLGKKHVNDERLDDDVLALFDDYHAKFDLRSKPATHLTALASLDDDALNEGLPGVLGRLVAHVQATLAELPE